MSATQQSFENHAKMVPGYHYVGTAFLLIPLVYFAVQAVTAFSMANLMTFVFALGVLVVGSYTRLFPLGVQDRVIRLEERIRLERVLPDELKGRIPEITTRQLIGLRFASDEEVPDLARRILDGELTQSKEIKAAVKNWRADHQRI